ncbi:hypothetical protein MET9862_03267 [Methylobacterium symbioticum]|uniref:Uncharacterized protein n=1 Tax=Methylobacterium symbioticum TaxID=2584084 RepID=A0A509EEB1_9HYPH|nr:hypothetical protein MET9862_03267 [Methylobacterium symbioticum]
MVLNTIRDRARAGAAWAPEGFGIVAVVSSLPFLSVAGIASGVAMALHAQRRERARQRYEGVAGLLLASGLLMIGLGLPVFR